MFYCVLMVLTGWQVFSFCGVIVYHWCTHSAAAWSSSQAAGSSFKKQAGRDHMGWGNQWKHVRQTRPTTGDAFHLLQRWWNEILYLCPQRRCRHWSAFHLEWVRWVRPEWWLVIALKPKGITDPRWLHSWPYCMKQWLKAQNISLLTHKECLNEHEHLNISAVLL